MRMQLERKAASTGVQLLLVVVCMWVHPARAFDPEHLQALLNDGNCSGCDLRGADLRNRDLSSAQLDGADLRDAQLAGSSFVGANLRGALLVGVDLFEVRLSGADLRDADLSHLHIDRDLEFIDLTGVLLEGAKFSGGQRCGALPAIGGWGCSTP